MKGIDSTEKSLLVLWGLFLLFSFSVVAVVSWAEVEEARAAARCTDEIVDLKRERQPDDSARSERDS